MQPSIRAQTSIRALPPRVAAVLKAVAEIHDIQVADILAKDAHAPIVAARREAIQRLREEFSFSLSHIGRLLGIHHTSVIYHLKGMEPRPPFDFSKPDESGVWAI